MKICSLQPDSEVSCYPNVPSKKKYMDENMPIAWADDGIWAVLNSFRSIRTVPRGPSGCAKRAPGAQNILSAVLVNSTCKIKIKSHGPTMASRLCWIAFEAFVLCPTGRVTVLTPRAQNILSAVIVNSTCKIKIESHGPMMASELCWIAFEAFVLCPAGQWLW